MIQSRHENKFANFHSKNIATQNKNSESLSKKRRNILLYFTKYFLVENIIICDLGPETAVRLLVCFFFVFVLTSTIF